jgi:uncharacterized protein YbjT (DUF2867 family)
VLSQFSAELAFSAAVSFGIFVCTAFVFGSHQGIRTAVTRYSLLMIRSFDRSRLTFMMNGQFEALAEAYGAVNAVSLYVEHGRERFHSVHVASAQRVAAQAQRAGVKRLIHVSGIGADPRSQSLYIRKRGEGELAVRVAFADAILIHPAVMFGPDDAFLTTILKLLGRLPIYPMFGNGQMRLQPVCVEDVGQAIAKLLGTHWLGSLKCCRARQSREIKFRAGGSASVAGGAGRRSEAGRAANAGTNLLVVCTRVRHGANFR